ncbi:MAG: hypothetical protein QXU40_03325 [Candidatus Pacearchaeota archaeon]
MNNNLGKFEEIRFWLFTQSYIATEVRKKLREKYGLPKISSRITPIDKLKLRIKWYLFLLSKYSNLQEEIIQCWKKKTNIKVRYTQFTIAFLNSIVERKITPEITLLADKLKLNENCLREFILFDIISEKLYPYERIVYANPFLPIEKEGFYVQFDERLTQKEWMELFNEAKKRIRQHELLKKEPDKLIFLSDSPNHDFIIRKKRKQFGKNEKLKIMSYCLVEKHIKKIRNQWKKEQLNGQTKILPSDYYNSLVENAIGAAVQEMFDKLRYSESKQDTLFEGRSKRIETYYYVILKRYQLPTPKKLTFFLRLIES